MDGTHLGSDAERGGRAAAAQSRSARASAAGVLAAALLRGITTMRIRLLGDRVSRAVAWQVAKQLDWDDTTNAEYVAVAKLQADVFVTLDPELARQVAGIVPTAPFEALVRAS